MRGMRAAVGVGCGAAWLVIATVPAGADVVDPEGSCSAVGQWQEEGVTRASTEFNSDDVIEIPQQDTVLWGGAVGDAQLGDEVERREISGEVEVDIAGIGSATIDDWGGSSVRAANEGEHEYDIPDILLNVKMRLHGEHREGGVKVCSGSVYLQAKAGRFENPLAIAALIGMLATGGGLASAGVVRKKWAYEDINPG